MPRIANRRISSGQRRVDLIALDGVLDSALGITLDVLRAANRIALATGGAAPFGLRILSARRTLRTSAGLRIAIDATLPSSAPSRRAEAPDILVVLGLDVPLRHELEAALARPDVGRAMAHIRRAAEAGALVAAACSGTFVCAEAGVLDGRAATTSWWLAPVFRARYPAVELREDAMVIDAGAIVTAGAAMSHVDLALHLVRRFAGPTIAETCTRYLIVDERPAQSRYVALDQLAHHSERVGKAEAFARRSLHRDIGVADLARAAAASTRTLEREFRSVLGVSPIAFLQKLRVERAIHLLHSTRDSVEQVAARVGYSDAVSLRRVLRQYTGQTASALRGGQAAARRAAASRRAASARASSSAAR